MGRKHRILSIIVLAQFCATSLWFVSNSIIEELVSNFSLGQGSLGYLTSAIQLGFITGSLIFAVFTFSDRFRPSGIFLLSATLGALFNLMIVFDNQTLMSLVTLRCLTGFFLAGVYPVGLKIVADYYKTGLGGSLSFLVGALVLGTAFPHFMRSIATNMPWEMVVWYTSGIALTGGVLMFIFVPDGPYRKKSKTLDLTSFFRVFKIKEFRIAAYGYFSHMWELYAFWAFVPVMLSTYRTYHPSVHFDSSLWAFLIIGVGMFACVIGGILSNRFGAKRIAFVSLSLSAVCCLLSPLIFYQDSVTVFIGFLIFWGCVVIADSPLFSTLIAQHTEPETKGTALTIVNCIGFFITIISIQFLEGLAMVMDARLVYVVLGLGPIFGFLVVLRNHNSKKQPLTI